MALRVRHALALLVGAPLALLPGVAASASAARALPDGRAYQLVTPIETEAEDPVGAVPAVSGEAVDFQAAPFGDATAGGEILYQARHTGGGWQTVALTPKDVAPPQLLGETAPMFLTLDLTHTVFLTEQPFATGDDDSGALDLYEQQPDGTLSWVSQGTEGGSGPDSVTYDGATPDGNQVVFDSAEMLLPSARGLMPGGSPPAEYLYDRNIAADTTTLVDVDDEGKVLNPAGAILGNGNYLNTGEPPVFSFLAADYAGTTTHAISDDGTKIFFESPAPSLTETALNAPRISHEVHLYMREDDALTVSLDDPTASGGAGARYLGASESGAYVFFVSDEGLAGNQFKDTELYVYETETGVVRSISSSPAGEPTVDGGVYGVTAIANDGSRIYYVARSKLASNINSFGQAAVSGQPNLYVYETGTHENAFIAQLGVSEVEPYPGHAGRLVSYLDLERLAVPTPDGEVLAFVSAANLTEQNAGGTPQVYRYDAGTHSLICISCEPAGPGGSSLGIGVGGEGSIGGGSYDPPGQSAPMNATGEQIFFETEKALVPEDENSNAPPSVFELDGLKERVPNDVDVYEWHNGRISLISGGKTGLTTLQGVTPSGEDVLFATNVDLTGQTNGYMALYDARVPREGEPLAAEAPAAPATCDSGESCRGVFGGAPPFAVPGSAALAPAVEVAVSTKPTKPGHRKPQKRIKRGRRVLKRAGKRSKHRARTYAKRAGRRSAKHGARPPEKPRRAGR